MANSNKSIVVGKLQGMLGKELVFRNWQGKTVVAKAPQGFEGKPTPEQSKIRENFGLGARYAKKASKNPELAAAYKSVLRPRQNVYSRALQDFVTPPRILGFHTREYQGVVGNPILINATDDFNVKEVFVEIYSAAGVLLEQGKAGLVPDSNQWLYTATVVNSQVVGSVLKAIAIDTPGNEGSLEIILG